MTTTKLVLSITYNDEQTTPDYLIWGVQGLSGVLDTEATDTPYGVFDDGGLVAVLPDRLAATETLASLHLATGYVAPAWGETI